MIHQACRHRRIRRLHGLWASSRNVKGCYSVLLPMCRGRKAIRSTPTSCGVDIGAINQCSRYSHPRQCVESWPLESPIGLKPEAINPQILCCRFDASKNVCRDSRSCSGPDLRNLPLEAQTRVPLRFLVMGRKGQQGISNCKGPSLRS